VIIQDTCLKGWTDETSEEFTVPEGIKSIGANAFEGKTNLTAITFNKGLEEIGDSAFYGCTGLTVIVLPASLQKIDNSAFENCGSLSKVEFSLNDGGSNTNLSKVGTCAFAGCSDNIEFVNIDRLDELGDKVGNCAFGHEDGIKESRKHEKLPTCTETGIDSVIIYCEICGAEHTENGMKETVEPLGHSFTNYIYNNDATAEKDGTETAKCERCDETDTKTVKGSKELANYDIVQSLSDDNLSLTITATNKEDQEIKEIQTAQAETDEVKPTCTTPGRVTYKYTFTGILSSLSTEKTFEKDPALGHSFTNYTYNNDATTEKDGTETAKCDRCEATDTRVKPGTKLPDTPDKPATPDDPDKPDEPTTPDKPEEKAPDIEIRNYRSSLKVDYRAKLTFNAEVKNADGYEIVWTVNGNKYKGASYTIEKATEKEYKISVSLVKDGKTVKTSAEETVTVNTGFFAKIIAFFRSLFKALPVYVDNRKK
jgi:hypothetical protein